MKIIDIELGYTLRDIKAGDVFRFNGLMYLKTSEPRGFDEDGQFILCVNMASGETEDIHENSYVTLIEGRFIIEDEHGCSNGSD